MQSPPAPLDNGRVNVKFVEYMMGLEKGWVTDMDIPLTQKFKLLGNGVVPQQAYYALQQLLDVDTPSEQDLC
jgi:DNA (cytosine-5)-methyltransferase 1